MFHRLGDDLTSIVIERRSRRTSRRYRRVRPANDADNVLAYMASDGIPMMQAAAEDVAPYQVSDELLVLERLRKEMAPASRAAYLARTFFDAGLMLIAPTAPTSQ